MKYTIVYATDLMGGFGLDGHLPHFKHSSLPIFKELTRVDNSWVVMGSRTWKSLPSKLPDRTNVVVSSGETQADHTFASLKDLYNVASEVKDVELFVVGGAKLIDSFLRSSLFELHDVYHSIHNEYTKSTLRMQVNWEEYGLQKVRSDGEIITTEYWSKINPELMYLNTIKNIMLYGQERNDRTGTGTIGLWNQTMRYSLSNGQLPMFTTKRMFFKGILEELLWFIRGDTSSKSLEEKGVNFWKDNASKKFLEERGLPYDEGDLGPIYGFQWRHWGKPYNTEGLSDEMQGIDQLEKVIDQIKNGGHSRRIIMTAWNVSDLDKMALPPCHTLCQFSVRNEGLSCTLFQRSGDMGLGVPFNVTSYSILTHLLAYHCNLRAHEFVHVITDAHIYKDHVEPLKEQLTRIPFDMPKIKIMNKYDSIDNYKYEDIIVEGYKSHKNIRMIMAI